MTVKEYILQKELYWAQTRFEALQKVGCPEIMLTALGKEIDKLNNGIIKVGGDNTLLNLFFEVCEVKKGKGGKIYIEFDCGIKYFPTARYGRFITR